MSSFLTAITLSALSALSLSIHPIAEDSSLISTLEDRYPKSFRPISKPLYEISDILACYLRTTYVSLIRAE
ncbi:hypothetical protein F4805DRAFT_410439 [Annulohypoxylon moriforme]|nr:hypothetical protein F4805DRAFT_410439 [Annulohypoxylon moriforme]